MFNNQFEDDDEEFEGVIDDTHVDEDYIDDGQEEQEEKEIIGEEVIENMEVSIEPDQQQNSPDNDQAQAFARVRAEGDNWKRQFGEVSNTVNELDQYAKTLGFQGANDFIEKTKMLALQQQAEQTGVPVEYLQQQKAMAQQLDQMQHAYYSQQVESRNKTIVNDVLNTFEKEGLSIEEQKQIISKFGSHGVTFEQLAKLQSEDRKQFARDYISPTVKQQKALEKKKEIQNTVPISQGGTISAQTESREQEHKRLALELFNSHHSS